ncbi:MAG: hypothetical protein QW179_01935 [Candidatus Hadarchaeales archaeon]
MKWKYKQLHNIVKEPIKHYQFTERRTGGSYRSYIFKTIAHPWLAELHAKFYRGGRKTVPDDIKDMLTPLVLAVWYMDDGSLSKGAPILNTQGYSVEEQFKLLKALRKFHIIGNINKDRDKYRIRILKRHAKKFAEIIRPYVLPEFAYKLP